MNRLVLVGKMVVKDDARYLRFCSPQRVHLLPLCAEEDFPDGTWVRFEGILRTENVPGEGRSRKIWICRGTLTDNGVAPETYINDFTVLGTVVKVSELRMTPLTSRKIVDFIVTEGGSYFNCIAFGKAAERLILEKSVGDVITVSSAAFQSRDYEKEGEIRTAYEVCVSRFV